MTKFFVLPAHAAEFLVDAPSAEEAAEMWLSENQKSACVVIDPDDTRMLFKWQPAWEVVDAVEHERRLLAHYEEAMERKEVPT